MIHDVSLMVRFCDMDADPALSAEIAKRLDQLARRGEAVRGSVSVRADARRGTPGYVVHARLLTSHGSISVRRDERSAEIRSAGRAVHEVLDALERRLDIRERWAAEGRGLS